MATDTSENKRKELTDAAYGEPPPIPKQGEEDKRGLYSFARFTVQGDHYVGFYQTWVKTILFLLGRQWLKWLDGKRRYSTDTDVPAWRQQPVTNVVYAAYRTLAAKLTKQRPTFEVVPPSGDSDDRESAQLGQAILEHLWRLLKLPQKIRRAMGWFLCAGQVYIRVHWDETAGKRVPLTKLVEVPHSDPALAAQGETEDVPCPCDADGSPILAAEADNVPRETLEGEEIAPPPTHPYDLTAPPAMVPQGEIAFDYDDPMSVRFNPEAEDADDAYEMFVAKLWPKHKALKHFEMKETELDSGGDGDRQMYQDLMASAASGSGWLGGQNILGSQLGASQDEAMGDRVLVLEYYHDTCEDFPDGRHWISIGRTKVWPKADDPDYPAGEAPLPNGFWPPLIPVLSLPIPGQPQAMGVLPQIVTLNEQLNTLDGKIKENEFTMSMGGKYIKHPADKGLSINSDPAQVLTSKGYALGMPPVQMTIKGLPQEVYAERDVIMEKIRLVGSLSSISMSKKPEGVVAGRPMLVMQEESDSPLTPDLESWGAALEEAGRRFLVLAQRYYREERKIQIRGERGQWEIRSFQGSDLSDGLDVRVQIGSTFPWSKAAQWDAKMEMLGRFPGLVQSPDGTVDTGQLAHFLDTGDSGLSSFESDQDPDLVEIQREHAMFEAYDPDDPFDLTQLQAVIIRDSAPEVGLLPALGFWQSIPKHLEGHYRFMKLDFARFQRWSQWAQAVFMEHCKLTAQAVDELAEGLVNATGAGLPGGPEMPAPTAQAGPDGQPMPQGGAMPPEGPGATPQQGIPMPPPGINASNQDEQPALSRADFASAGQ